MARGSCPIMFRAYYLQLQQAKLPTGKQQQQQTQAFLQARQKEALGGRSQTIERVAL